MWVSFCLNNSGNLRSNETIDEAVGAMLPLSNLDAVLFNCSSHESTLIALSRLRRSTNLSNVGDGLHLGAYANGFSSDIFDHTSGSQDEHSEYCQKLTPEVYMDQAKQWLDIIGDRNRPSIVGGCCACLLRDAIATFATSQPGQGKNTYCPTSGG